MKLNALIFFTLVLTLAGCDTNSVDTKTTDGDTKSELVGADSDL